MQLLTLIIGSKEAMFILKPLWVKL